jgi:cytochrome c peroxidase
MKYVTSLLAILFLGTIGYAAAETAFPEILRQQIIANGFKSANELYRNPDEGLITVGEIIFESKKLSLNGDISCRTCHIPKFGSADGIPNAAAIFGKGEGPDRLLSGAKLLPRNALALWGRGANGFDSFFWDGRVDFRASKRLSPFGSHAPSDDGLTTAAHLPVVEIREMLDEDSFVRAHKKESVEQAGEVYSAIAANLTKNEPGASNSLATYLRKSAADLTYTDYARAIASFIRSQFRIRETKLERFVSRKEELTSDELEGGVLFYGNGKCASCHTGPHFTDFEFHIVPFPQLGFGKNGFGVDYGRFNVTFDSHDLYKFRTAPLFNVEKTAPYGHSGSVATMEEAITAHFDPLKLVDVTSLEPFTRYELYKRLALSEETARTVGYLSSEDVRRIAVFLKTLSF